MAENAYPLDKRVRARAAYKHMHDLAAKLKAWEERREPMSAEDAARIVQLTKSTAPDTQFKGLMDIADMVRGDHLKRLEPLCHDEFNAFCEYVDPEEPPASPWHVWLTGKLQEIEVDPKLNRFVLNCPPGHAKPLHVDTPVLMGDGSYKRLGDVKVGDFVVSAERRIRRVTAVHEQGVLPLLRITTNDGRVIHSAHDHSFRVTLPSGTTDWRHAEALRPGDVLDVIGGPELEPAGADVSADLADLAAWWSAYGSCGHYKNRSGTPQMSPHLWLPDRARTDRARALLDRMGVAHACHKVGISYAVRITPTKNRELVAHLSLEATAAERRVPAWIMTADDDTVRRFLSLFTAERAEVPKSNVKSGRPRVICYMRSEALAVDLQRLFARLGVPVEVRRPEEGMGGRPHLIIHTAALQAYFAAGLTFDSALADRLESVPLTGSAYTEGFTDTVHTIEVVADGECRCLTVDKDHTFLAEGVVVHNSTYASRRYVGWRLGRNPDLQIIGGGHGQTFVENEFSAKIRTLVNSTEFKTIFPDVRVDHTQRAKGQWRIVGRKGQYVAKGVGQGVHGFRANMIVVDDPYSKVEDAESPSYREKVNTWFLTDIGTRLLPGGKVFVIMTRFHEEDLTGMIVELNKKLPANKKYQIVSAPAVCYDPENDVLNRQLGDVLWDYYSAEELLEKKISQKFQRYALIYQQLADAAAPDNIASKFRYYDELPHKTEAAYRKAKDEGNLDDLGRPAPKRSEYFRRVVLAVDTATKDTARADYTVVQVWGETHSGQHYLIDQKREKVEFTALVELIESTARYWDADLIMVEDKGNGTSYLQARGATDNQRRLAPCPLLAIKVDAKQGKVFRFDEITPMIEHDQCVWLPSNAPWLELFIREVGQFPEGGHDDQVDALSHYLKWAKSKGNKKYGSKKVKSHG